MSDQNLGVMLRGSLMLFVERAFMHLSPSIPFAPNWHLELIAAKLEAVLDGRIKRLIVNVPPRSLKSVMASVAFIAWALGHRPTMQIICASYGQHLADKHADDCRNLMLSQWYARTFPTRLRGARPAVSDLRTTAGGGRFATSVGGVLTGLGGDLIVIDDPLKPDEAVSETTRNAANAWIDNTVMSRFNDKRHGAMVIIMQRLHLDDVVGHVQEHGDWEGVSLPAIAEIDEVHTFETLTGPQTIKRRTGEALHPETRVGRAARRLAPHHGRVRLLRTVPAGTGAPRRRDCQARLAEQGDRARGLQRLHDVGHHQDSQVPARRAARALELSEAQGRGADQIQRFKPQVVLIEDKASGTQLIQQLRQDGVSIVKEIKPKGNKTMRMHAQTAAFEGGFVKLPRRAAWLDAYVLELTTFPRARHDDQVDSTAQALAWIVEFGSEPGILTYLREEFERGQRGG